MCYAKLSVPISHWSCPTPNFAAQAPFSVFVWHPFGLPIHASHVLCPCVVPCGRRRSRAAVSARSCSAGLRWFECDSGPRPVSRPLRSPALPSASRPGSARQAHRRLLECPPLTGPDMDISSKQHVLTFQALLLLLHPLQSTRVVRAPRDFATSSVYTVTRGRFSGIGSPGS